MPSTRASIRATKSTSVGASGATVKPQFPPSTVVTPCRQDGLNDGSHSTWAS